MKEAIVSIIVPVHNAGEYIEETIASVLSQSFEEWELILVDDCSTDDSVEKINKYLSDERICLVKNEVNLKAARTRNAGIDRAKGRYIAFLDADDKYLPDKLSIQLQFMKEKECAFSYTEYEFGDENANGTGKIVRVLPVLTYKKALSRTIIFTSTVMFDTSKVSKETIKMPDVASEDTATWWKVLRSGYNAYGIDQVLTIYRRPKESLSSDKFLAIKRIWNLYRNVEKINICYSAYNFVFWAIRATLRRI